MKREREREREREKGRDLERLRIFECGCALFTVGILTDSRIHPFIYSMAGSNSTVKQRTLIVQSILLTTATFV